MPSVIGIRKMAVIMWCAMCISGIEIVHVILNKPSDAVTITICGLVAGLGGFHSWKQGIIDKDKNND